MHRWTQLFIPTLREAPADAEVASHKFLVRAGYIRQLAAGIYSYTFLGQRSLLKITGIVRREMDKIGQEFYLPAIHPREIWEASGRWAVMGDTMFRLQDRGDRDLCLGMTHEEVVSEIARKELRSYKQLPQVWYQIQSKFRDEPRPKSGLLRTRQFTMKDSYSFDIDAAGLDLSYQKHDDAYHRIFDGCGLQYRVVEAHSGAMGGSQSHEFMIMSDAGEDLVVFCENCGYAANTEKAISRLDAVVDLAPEGGGAPLLVATPGKKTIAEVSEFLGVSPRNKIKTLALVITRRLPDGKDQIVERLIVLLRGDHTLNEAKLLAEFPAGSQVRPMEAAEIESAFGGPAGFLGPVGIAVRSSSGGPADEAKPLLLADLSLTGRTYLIAGANREDYHLKNVTPDRDYRATRSADLRMAAEGDQCPHCEGRLRLGKALEIGHIFKLGYKYSESMGIKVLNQDGKEVHPIMGSYGIGIERILAGAVEQNNDKNGFWLPPQIAPFDVNVVVTNVGDETLLAAATTVAEALTQAGWDVLLDDRDERAGVKFKDADLIGVPFRINVGKKVSQGMVEVVRRSTGESVDANIGEIAALFQELAGRGIPRPAQEKSK